MQFSKTGQNSAGSDSIRGLLARFGLLIGCLLLMCTLSPAHASEDNYRSKEEYTYAAQQRSVDLTLALSINTPLLLSSIHDTDSHLINYQHQALWFESGIWISNIGTLLYLDNDRDGYFSGFSLTIDADTDYPSAEVFATIDIQHAEGERERLHTSGTFSLYGNSLTDEYRIDIELVNNYPIGEYDLFVTLVDAYDFSALDSVNADDLSNLSRLPLESEDVDNDSTYLNLDAPFRTQQINADIRVVEYTGAGSAWIVAVLGLLAIARQLRWTNKSTALLPIGTNTRFTKFSILKTYSYYVSSTFLQSFIQPRRILNKTTLSEEHHHWNKDLNNDGQLPGSTPTLTG